MVYSRTNQTGKAIDVYTRALKLSPHDPLLNLNLGLVYLKRDDYQAALPYFQETVSRSPGHRQARELLATCRLYTGDLSAAMRDLEILRADDPLNTGILYLLGVGYLKQKNPTRAKAVLDEMFGSAATPAQANFILGKTYYDAGQFSESEQFYRKALEFDGGTPGVQLELAKVYLSERQTEQAITQLKQILTATPQDADANYFLGGALVQNGDYQEGIQYLEKARQLNPEAWGIYFYLGKARLQLGRPAEAAALLKKSIELNPTEAAVFYQLARAEKALGSEKEAQVALEHVKELKARGLNREIEVVESRGAR